MTFLGISIKIKQDFWTTKNSSPAFVHLVTIYQLWKREKKTLSLKLYYARWIQMGMDLFYVYAGSICKLSNRAKMFLKSDKYSRYFLCTIFAHCSNVSEFLSSTFLVLTHFNQCSTFIHPENPKFADVFRGYRRETLVENRLRDL